MGNGPRWGTLSQILQQERIVGRSELPETTHPLVPMTPYCGNTGCQVKGRFLEHSVSEWGEG